MSTELDANTFDVLNFVQGANYPTHEVDIYTDFDSLFKAGELFREREAASRRNRKKIIEPSEEELALREKVKESALTFKLRGISPEKVRPIRDAVEAKPDESEDEYSARVLMAIIPHLIVGVKRADGALDTQPWTTERLEQLDAHLPASEGTKLFQAGMKVIGMGATFEAQADAGFLGGRAYTGEELRDLSGSGDSNSDGDSSFGPAANRSTTQ